ncbi:hypothetical protein ACOI1H_15050, partial [Loktanella sp. DJP18]|uniref:hypothetical protein n=1 Tax=Loktanella sp. DJP18 TaxID=3409788 RepID=UPI003BB5D8D1
MTTFRATLRCLGLTVTLAVMDLTTPGTAQPSLVVGNDRGGLVSKRAQEVNMLRRNGQRVEIRGRICYSSCTLYLGASDVCISPQTTFGFHGPSRNGTPLPADQFESWSRLMASYYNPPLQHWFMQQGRYAIHDLYEMSGSQLIRMGYRT